MEVSKELYRRELLKGSTDTLLLSLLAEESMYGYKLVKEMDKRSSGYFQFKEGTLYPALHRLERDGMIQGSCIFVQSSRALVVCQQNFDRNVSPSPESSP